jgi:hypothetical protein
MARAPLRGCQPRPGAASARWRATLARAQPGRGSGGNGHDAGGRARSHGMRRGCGCPAAVGAQPRPWLGRGHGATARVRSVTRRGPSGSANAWLPWAARGRSAWRGPSPGGTLWRGGHGPGPGAPPRGAVAPGGAPVARSPDRPRQAWAGSGGTTALGLGGSVASRPASAMQAERVGRASLDQRSLRQPQCERAAPASMPRPLQCGHFGPRRSVEGTGGHGNATASIAQRWKPRWRTRATV